MFVGHFGLGFAPKRVAPTVSLGTLFLSVHLADGLWPLFLLLGLEHVRIVRVLAFSGLAMGLTIPWGYWVDRHRVLRLRRRGEE